MKRITLVVVIALTTQISYAQLDSLVKDTAWTLEGVLSITGSQVSLTNWQAGGENSISGNGFFNLTADYNKDKLTWESYIEGAIGGTRIGGDDLRKTDDRFEIGTKFGYQLSRDWQATGFSTFRTQFTEGFELLGDTARRRISHIMAPGYLFAGLGAQYSPVKWFRINIAPLSSKMTFVRVQNLANQGAFGVEPATYDENGEIISEGENTRVELGGYVKIWAKKKIMDNVTMETKADFFSNYQENPQNIDITWDVMVNLKVNKWLSANITTNLIYDDDIMVETGTNEMGETTTGPRVQFKEVFGAGLSVNF
ncbi:DUF3078 domain-containing protein [Salibacter sp.]|uniref:DUF3078 domain-containing protein n=1 Tax=Salibacter sp. TaxID=2010995 RepID=UPI0028706DDD|nr:DUF3078 domain-containing protein [Salibacter sp.]MDR9398230.1 DUF3078 domain-containing protein [Salibacter sp.]MDR9487466.1 DUF3078 domain-containing protein [Salibacter sp.]